MSETIVAALPVGRTRAEPQGQLDAVTLRHVAGWAFDPAAPDVPVSLLISVDGTLVGRALANRYRADLANGCFGNGRHGFNVPLEDAIPRLRPCTVRVRRQSDGSDLPGSPVVLRPPTRLDPETRDWLAAMLDRPCDDEELQSRLGFLATLTDRLLQRRADDRSRPGEPIARARHRWRWLPTTAPVESAVRAPRALVVDDRMPVATRDAGSQALLSHMLSLRRLGYEVVLAAADMQQADIQQTGDRAALEAAGIACCGAPWHGSVEEILRREADGFDVVYLHRVGVASRYMALARHHMPRARLIYSVADLHHLRLARQGAIEQRPELLAHSRRLHAAELMAAWSADAVITHSPEEAALLRRQVPGVRVHVVPWAACIRPTRAPFAARRGIAFIGGYEHAPNRDAAEFLTETVMPLVRARLPYLQCLLVGSALPDSLRRKRPGVVPVGQVADLATIFDRVRLTVAPLRFGAGIKGKVLASLAAGVPCACTPVAAEGMDLPAPLQAIIAEDAAGLAAAICRLHEDVALNDAGAAAGLEYAAEHWCETAVDAAMQEVVPSRQQPHDGPVTPPATPATLPRRASAVEPAHEDSP